MAPLTDDLDGFPRLSPGGDRRASAMTSQQIVGAIGLVVTLFGMVFTAGYNWRGVAEVKESLEQHVKIVQTEYVRKDVNAQQMITLETKLDEIAAQLAQLQRANQK